MRDALFQLYRDDDRTLQAQIQDLLTQAIIEKQLDPGASVPSTRAMATRLGVSRNTVTIAYQALVADGFLKPKDRSGYYVDEEVGASYLHHQVNYVPREVETIDWASHLVSRPGDQANIRKPVDWQSFPYPFIYGQTDPALFPISEWRDCTRQAMGKRWVDSWMADHFEHDDPKLIDQVQKRVLMRRGIYAKPEEILITMGAQNALYILASLLVDHTSTVAVEDPGYPDARNIFGLMTKNLRPVPVDGDGLVVDQKLDGADVVFVTPSHQAPTAVTMPMERRQALLAKAHEQNAIIIEDDYEFETNYVGQPSPALKSLDKTGRVIYVGSLSKSVMHGLRLGFVVGGADLIAEARALRRLILRHPPGNNQRTMALFLGNGHHDRFVNRLHRVYRERWLAMRDALDEHLTGWSQMPSFGGSSVWVSGPPGLDADRLAQIAREEGILIEPGSIYFSESMTPNPYFRLGFGFIPTERISPGIQKLAEIIKSLFPEAEK